ncbi:MAG TPA: PPOX class F420-dependent oxidoreductase [Anaerolineae bacterium]|nr:PPOX class F420-dependent oxidoreductase [Anaerolineae bacterium]HMR64032.1 PPOX class F420-dependent oxidoreductase [Anaerolineae bacterium]
MQEMTAAEVRSFLLDTARTATLATVRADGRPHAAPIWFDLDGETVIFTTWHESVKGQNIRRDGRVCLCIDDEKPPFTFVIIEGLAAVSEDEADLLHWATRIGGRYMGQALAEAYGQRNGVPGELLVRVKPAKIVAKKNIAD